MKSQIFNKLRAIPLRRYLSKLEFWDSDPIRNLWASYTLFTQKKAPIFQESPSINPALVSISTRSS